MQIRKMQEIPYSLKTVLMLDISPSVADDFEAIRLAALTLVENMVSQQEVAVWTFHSAVSQVLDFTSDQEALREAIEGITPPQGSYSTNLYGAVIGGVQQWTDIYDFEGTIQQGFLVAITDGADEADQYTLDEALSIRSGRWVYTIGLGEEINPDVLGQLGNKGFYSVAASEQLAGVFSDIQEDIVRYANSFYWLYYLSGVRDNDHHTLKLRVEGNNYEESGHELVSQFWSINFTDLSAGIHVFNLDSNQYYEELEQLPALEPGESLRLQALSHFGETLPAQITWTSGDETVLSIEPDTDDPAVVTLTCEGPGLTSLTVQDEANTGQGAVFSQTFNARCGWSRTVEVLQFPADLPGSGWTLSYADGDSIGTGDASWEGFFTGDVTVTWNEVVGYQQPSTRTLNPESVDEILFAGVYATETTFQPLSAGSFLMGSPEDEPGRSTHETQHEVTLTSPFAISTTEVTNAQYGALAQWALDNGHCTATTSSLRDALDGSTEELLDMNDGDCQISFSGGVFRVDQGKENHPVVELSWYGAVAYCDWLSLREGLTRAYDHGTWLCNGHAPYSAEGYRLPTEAEWEYACRAGSTTAFANGPITDVSCDDPNLDLIGWYCGTATHAVAQLDANSWGLYDMHGNVYEFCNDRYGLYSGDVTDPVGPGTGDVIMIRGGSYNYSAHSCRSARRNNFWVYDTTEWLGFRPVRSTE